MQDFTHAERALLMLYASHSQPGGVDFYPSDNRVADSENWGRATVQRAKSGLFRKGCIEICSKEPGRAEHLSFTMTFLTRLGLPVDREEVSHGETPRLPAPANGNRPAALRTTKLAPAPPAPELPTVAWDDEEMRIRKYTWYVFQYYSAMERKHFANQQETQDYQFALDQLMQLGISEQQLQREYQQKGVKVP